MKLPINWEAFLTLSLLLTMNKSVTFKFNLLLSLIMHTFSSGYLISIRSLFTPFATKSCGWRSLDRRMLSDALRCSQLSSSPSTLDAQTVDELFDLYTSTMNQLIDTMLPLRELKTRCQPLAVWFDSDCHRIRRRSRCLERRFRRTRDPADKLAWITQLRALHQLYRRKEAAHWENLVKRNEKTQNDY